MTGLRRFCLTLSLLGMLSGCSTGEPPPVLNPMKWLTTGSISQDCDASTPQCLERRSAELRSMLSDKSHAWVDQAPGPEKYTSGTRLFAYRMARAKLKCRQLSTGIAELERAREAYGKPIAGVPGPEAQRVRQLVLKVHGELAAEKRRRCRS